MIRAVWTVWALSAPRIARGGRYSRGDEADELNQKQIELQCRRFYGVVDARLGVPRTSTSETQSPGCRTRGCERRGSGPMSVSI